MKAYLKNYRQSPRKVRLVAGLVRGKNVEDAMVSLSFLAKGASTPLRKLLISAVANAKQMGIEKENLLIKELRVDKGITMKRMMPRAMGRGHRINKRTSHITLALAEKVVSVPATKKIKAEAKTVEVKKPKKVSAKTAKK
jgi:large subunit ribosomal protein L22